MQLDELSRALKQVAHSGQVGTPVALRLSAVANWPAVELADRAHTLLELAAGVLDDSPAQVSHVHDARETSCSLLARMSRGGTASVTVTRAATTALAALLVGNHGIAQLHGGEEWTGK